MRPELRQSCHGLVWFRTKVPNAPPTSAALVMSASVTRERTWLFWDLDCDPSPRTDTSMMVIKNILDSLLSTGHERNPVLVIERGAGGQRRSNQADRLP